MTWIKPALVGVAGATGSAGATWLYLASITIDDGLEGLIYLPILGAVLAVIGGWAGSRGMPWSWPRTAALGSAGATLVFLLALAAYRSDGTLARAALAASAVVAVFPFTGAIIGWGLTSWIKRSQ